MAIKTYKLNDSGKGRGMAKATHLHIDNKSTNPLLKEIIYHLKPIPLIE